MTGSSRILRVVLLAVYGLTSTVGVALHLQEHVHQHTHPTAAHADGDADIASHSSQWHEHSGHSHSHLPKTSQTGAAGTLTGEHCPADHPLVPIQEHDHDCVVCHLLAAKVMAPVIGISLNSTDTLRAGVVELDSRPIRRAPLLPVSRGPPTAAEFSVA